MNTAISSTSTTTTFKSSSNLQTKRHAAASVTLGQEGLTDQNEARYWTQKLGLGPSRYDSAKSRFAHPRSLILPPVRPAIVHQVLFGPPLNSKQPPLAVVCGPRVSLYGTSNTSAFHRALARHSPSTSLDNNIDADRQIQTGGHVAICASFRNDGRLLAVGTEIGEVRICDVTMRATLATFSATRFPIRSLQWLRNGQNFFSVGDDAVGRIWDLSSTDKVKPVLSLIGHGDVIRCSVLYQQSKVEGSEWNQLAMTGSYDHTVRVWNIQDPTQNIDEDRCIAVLSHGSPVESLCVMKSQNPSVPVWLLSAGGTTIKVWNPVTGQCHSTVATQHRKTITRIQSVIRSNIDEVNDTKTASWRILSSSLDGLLLFHSWDAATGTLNHLHSTKIGDAVSSVATDTTGDRFAIGSTTGSVIFKMKGKSIQPKKRTREPFGGTYAFFQRGMNSVADEGDYTVTAQSIKKKKLRSFDVALKQFRYSDALDDALATRRPKDVVAVLEEIGKRRGLTAALANRDEELLEPILAFTTRYINKPQYTMLLVGIAHRLIDIYGDVAGQSEMIDELFIKLRNEVTNECQAQKSLLKLVGQIDAVLSEAQTL